MDMCICITESLWWTSEINTTLQINYTSVKKKKVKEGKQVAHALYVLTPCGSQRRILNAYISGAVCRVYNFLLIAWWWGKGGVLGTSAWLQLKLTALRAWNLARTQIETWIHMPGLKPSLNSDWYLNPCAGTRNRPKPRLGLEPMF